MKALPDNRFERPITAIRTNKDRNTGFYNQINSMNKTQLDSALTSFEKPPKNQPLNFVIQSQETEYEAEQTKKSKLFTRLLNQNSSR